MEEKQDIIEEEDGYEPVHVGAMIVLVIVGIALLFWLFWCLLVFKGGLIDKVVLFFQCVFGPKTFAGLDPEGILDIWDGWIINLGALVILIGLIIGVWKIFSLPKKTK